MAQSARPVLYADGIFLTQEEEWSQIQLLQNLERQSPRIFVEWNGGEFEVSVF